MSGGFVPEDLGAWQWQRILGEAEMGVAHHLDKPLTLIEKDCVEAYPLGDDRTKGLTGSAVIACIQHADLTGGDARHVNDAEV